MLTLLVIVAHGIFAAHAATEPPNGISLPESGKWSLLAYFGDFSPHEFSIAVYLDELVRRFRDEGLAGIIVSTEGFSVDLATRHVQLLTATPQQIRGPREVIGRMRGSVSHLWLIDPTGRILFQADSNLLVEEDIRQITEKALLGHITRFDPLTAPILRPGDQGPKLWAENVQTGELIHIECGKGDMFTRLAYFPVACTHCGVGSQLEALAAAASHLGRRENSIAAVFSSHLSATDILSQASSRRITAPIFVAHEEITGLEDLYYTKATLGTQVLVRCDAQGIVRQVESLTDFLATPSEPTT